MRKDIVSLGGVASPNGKGVKIIDSEGGKKIKVFDAGFEVGAEGLHFFYFGRKDTPSNRRFLTTKSTGTFHKTFVQPRVGEPNDDLYLYSAVSETDMPFDVGYVKE